MVPARLFKAFANEDVLRIVLVTPEDIVLVIVSLRLRLGRIILGDGGCGDSARDRRPHNCGVRGSFMSGGGIWREVESNRVNGDSKRRART